MLKLAAAAFAATLLVGCYASASDSTSAIVPANDAPIACRWGGGWGNRGGGWRGGRHGGGWNNGGNYGGGCNGYYYGR